jgi:hypothetical protein
MPRRQPAAVGHQHRDLLLIDDIDLAYFKKEEAVNGRLPSGSEADFVPSRN